MAEPINTPDLNGILGSLLANPTALSGIVNLIGNMRTTPSQVPKSEEESGIQAETSSEESAVPASANANLNFAALAPFLSGVNALAPVKANEKKEHFDVGFDPMKRRRCLLEAIRPYLSPSRCENLNLLLRILDVLSLLSPKK